MLARYQDALMAHTSRQVWSNGKLIGYYTTFANVYVCIECGHLCECYETED